MHKFDKVHIEISNICNLQCTFCPEVVRTKKIMDLEFFEQTLIQVAPLTQHVCLHLMGEPTAHPDFEQILDLCEKHQSKIYLVTNGTLLDDQRSELLLHPCLIQVNFSLQSFFDNFPTKPKAPYLRKIFQFTMKAFEQRSDLYVNYRLWNLEDEKSESSNIEIYSEIEEFFKTKLDIPEFNPRKKSFKILNRLYLHFDTRFSWPSINDPILGTKGFCYGLSSHFGILSDGTVVPCCLDKEANINLGSLKEESLSSILNSPRASDILNGFNQKNLVEDLCQRCSYIKRFV